MYLKKHLSGECIVYDDKTTKKKSLYPTPPTEGRPQGSLYNQNKRKISDACEYLRLSLVNSPDRCPLIFTLTTPYENNRLADTPKFVSSFFENMRKNYGLGEYVWTREYTKKGSTHFHCIGDWYKPSMFYSCNIRSRLNLISIISVSWSNYFGSESTNSIWLGGWWYGKRIYSLQSQAQSRYITKYMGKDLSKTTFAKPVTIPHTILTRSPSRFASLNSLQSVKN